MRGGGMTSLQGRQNLTMGQPGSMGEMMPGGALFGMQGRNSTPGGIRQLRPGNVREVSTAQIHGALNQLDRPMRPIAQGDHGNFRQLDGKQLRPNPAERHSASLKRPRVTGESPMAASEHRMEPKMGASARAGGEDLPRGGGASLNQSAAKLRKAVAQQEERYRNGTDAKRPRVKERETQNPSITERTAACTVPPSVPQLCVAAKGKKSGRQSASGLKSPPGGTRPGKTAQPIKGNASSKKTGSMPAQERANGPTSQVEVSNISSSASKEVLSQYLSSVDEIVEIQLDGNCAKVTFSKPESAVKARRMFNNTELMAQRIKIQVVKTAATIKPEDLK